MNSNLFLQLKGKIMHLECDPANFLQDYTSMQAYIQPQVFSTRKIYITTTSVQNLSLFLWNLSWITSP